MYVRMFIIYDYVIYTLKYGCAYLLVCVPILCLYVFSR